MAEPTEKAHGRREFLRLVGLTSAAALARRLALAGIGATAGLLIRKSGRREECTNRGLCRGCPVLEGCGLPSALSMKRVVGR